MPECTIKHTKYQPTDDEWRCPGCGAGHEDGDGLCVDNSDNMECDKLHDNDELRCCKCDWEGWGAVFARNIVKKKGLVPCPHCKGSGFVKKGKG